MADPQIPNLTSESQRGRAESLLVTAYRSGLTDPKELANFMGQVQHESQNFSRLEENLNYSESRLHSVFGTRNGLTAEGAQEIGNIAEPDERRRAVAEQAYGGRWGAERLGNTEAGDGYAFRGRGYIQLTGRNNYQQQGNLLNLDLVKHPDLAADESNAERLAVSYWNGSIRRVPGASTDVTEAGSVINKGRAGRIPNGLADRQANATAWEAALSKEGYLEGVLQRYPAAPMASTSTTTASSTPMPAPARDPAPAMPQGALDEPLRLRPELRLSPESLRLLHSSEQQIRQLAQRHQLPWDAGLDNTVAAVASRARQDGLSDITHLNVTSGGQIRLAQFDGLTIRESSLDALAAANTTPQRSLGQMARLDQTQPQPQPQHQQPLPQAPGPDNNHDNNNNHNDAPASTTSTSPGPARTQEAPALSL